MINVENIRKEYSGKIILKDVSFKVDQGEIYGLVGKNGAGKTTLLNIMAGLVTPHSGKCLINGKEINRKTIVLRTAAAILLGMDMIRMIHTILQTITMEMERLMIRNFRMH